MTSSVSHLADSVFMLAVVLMPFAHRNNSFSRPDIVLKAEHLRNLAEAWDCKDAVCHTVGEEAGMRY